MKTQKSLRLILTLALSFTASSVFAVEGIDDSNHTALAEYYEIIAKETEAKLQQNKAALEEYEMHPYYYGRQGQDFRSHTVANIREYEAVLEESMNNAELHREMLMGHDNSAINKARINLDQDTSVIR
ncbi:hypothetical protein [Nitrosomonas supralitoralis]|uniref:DUF4168 domain-containing protein n=1 Tax=Nitrosomonas supralitoralis TaxID=2116706 RepID=A0A2P7NTR1_9PROT|nr:hypothetical protein [Nitrosomonas supralitoralis]PSJ16856.1 hypothetical protein C7H79_11295 [Nitrosomonas supralitoralis]